MPPVAEAASAQIAPIEAPQTPSINVLTPPKADNGAKKLLGFFPKAGRILGKHQPFRLLSRLAKGGVKNENSVVAPPIPDVQKVVSQPPPLDLKAETDRTLGVWFGENTTNSAPAQGATPDISSGAALIAPDPAVGIRNGKLDLKATPMSTDGSIGLSGVVKDATSPKAPDTTLGPVTPERAKEIQEGPAYKTLQDKITQAEAAAKAQDPNVDATKLSEARDGAREEFIAEQWFVVGGKTNMIDITRIDPDFDAYFKLSQKFYSAWEDIRNAKIAGVDATTPDAQTKIDALLREADADFVKQQLGTSTGEFNLQRIVLAGKNVPQIKQLDTVMQEVIQAQEDAQKQQDGVKDTDDSADTTQNTTGESEELSDMSDEAILAAMRKLGGADSLPKSLERAALEIVTLGKQRGKDIEHIAVRGTRLAQIRQEMYEAQSRLDAMDIVMNNKGEKIANDIEANRQKLPSQTTEDAHAQLVAEIETLEARQAAAEKLAQDPEFQKKSDQEKQDEMSSLQQKVTKLEKRQKNVASRFAEALGNIPPELARTNEYVAALYRLPQTLQAHPERGLQLLELYNKARKKNISRSLLAALVILVGLPIVEKLQQSLHIQ